MADDEEQPEGEPKKKSGLVMTIVAVLVLTVLGGGGGWFLGTMLAPKLMPPAGATPTPEPAHEAAPSGEHGKPEEGAKPGEGPPKISTEANNVIALEPITTNLFYPADSVIRIELALLFKGPPDVTMAEAIHQDVLEYLKTVSLQDVQGPSGFRNLKDDIQERVDLRSEGRVSQVMFRTFVIE